MRSSLQFGPGPLLQWVARLSAADLPILRMTARRLASVAADDHEQVGLRDLADLVLCDPLMTAKLYVHMRRVTGTRHELADITTVDRMILLLGVPPFLRAFNESLHVEDLLHGNTAALAGLIHVMQRARRASRMAGAFAVCRNDFSFQEIMVSALLHDLAEMLIWCYAPDLALEMKRRLDAEPTLRSFTVQEEVLGVRLNDLLVALAGRWRLPELLVNMIDHDYAADPRVRSVVLAVNIARHSTHGWDNAALPDDFHEGAALLSTTPEHVMEMVGAEPLAATA